MQKQYLFGFMISDRYKIVVVGRLITIVDRFTGGLEFSLHVTLNHIQFRVHSDVLPAAVRDDHQWYQQHLDDLP